MKSKHFDITNKDGSVTHDVVARIESAYLIPSIAIYGLNGSKSFVSGSDALKQLRDAINFAVGEDK